MLNARSDGVEPDDARPSLVVLRQRTLQFLLQAAPQVVVVAAPVGYGKSVLLEQLAAGDGRRTVWLDLADADTTGDGLDETLSGAVAGFHGPFLVLLDNLHRVTTQGGLDAIRRFAGTVPPGSTLVCAGRRVPDLRLGRIRATHNVVDIGLQHLAFDVGEAAELFGLAGVVVPRQALEALVERTEGWPAALRIAAVAVAQSEDPSLVAKQFAGDDRRLAELIDGEVLDELTADRLDLLVAIAPLANLSGPLCDAVLERTDSAAVLEKLAAETMLVVPLDDRRKWYRLHAALLAHLRSDHHHRDGLTSSEVLLRASLWFEENGDVNTAIALAAQRNDTVRATELVLTHFSAKVATGNPQAVDQWLAQLERGSLSSNPSLQAVAALVHMGIGDPEGVMRCLKRAEFGLPEPYPIDGEFEQPAACVAALRAGLGRSAAEDMRRDSRYARAHTKSPFWYGSAGLSDGASSLMLGDLLDAEEALQASAAIAEEVSYTNWALSRALLALVYERAGDFERAVAAARHGKQIVKEQNLIAIPQMYLVHLVGAYFDAVSGDGGQAAVGKALGLAHRARCVGIAAWAQLVTAVVLARMAHLAGDPSEKERWLTEADVMLQSVPDALVVKDQISEVRRVLTTPSRDETGQPLLSAAELRVVQFLPTHLSLAAIADELFLSRHTVKSHVVAIYRKLDVVNRRSAVLAAQRSGALSATSAGVGLRPR